MCTRPPPRRPTTPQFAPERRPGRRKQTHTTRSSDIPPKKPRVDARHALVFTDCPGMDRNFARRRVSVHTYRPLNCVAFEAECLFLCRTRRQADHKPTMLPRYATKASAQGQRVRRVTWSTFSACPRPCRPAKCSSIITCGQPCGLDSLASGHGWMIQERITKSATAAGHRS